MFSSRLAGPSSDDSTAAAAINGDLEKLKRLRRTIQQDHVDVAEEGEVPDELERKYLSDLREVALDAEDVLGQWEYELLRAKVEGRSGADLALRILQDEAALRNQMAVKIGGIMSWYLEIRHQNDALRLPMGDGARRRGGHSNQRPPPSSSLVDERYVFNREDYDKGFVVDVILGDTCSTSDLTVMPIVGMGLVGKTTFAQLIYKDTRVVQKFARRGWVSVSTSSGLKNLLQRVAEALTSEPCRYGQLDTVQCILQERLRDKSFLLVLDDVCVQLFHILDKFKASFSSGSQGSVILITTQNEEVTKVIQTVPALFLYGCISDDNCWLLFKSYAFDGRNTLQGPDMAGIRDKVVKICEGLPSVAKMLGVSFRCRRREEEWMDFMENVVEDEILPALQSSYSLLPAYLKPCLLYCSLFPKNFWFKKDELVRLWIAQCLIQPKNRKRPEDIRIEYYSELLSRSFFLQKEDDLENYFIPNLIWDLIHSISRNEHGMVEDINSLPSKARHLSLVLPKYRSLIKGEYFYKFSHLRSFLVMRTFPHTSILNLEIQDSMFTELNQLRSLDLSYTNIRKLPDSIGHLKHLHFLALNYTKIKRLPESIHKLYNLQILELKQCPGLQELPRGTSSLINLRYLDVDSDYFPVCMPFQIQRLTSLQKLPTFNLHKGNDFGGISELQDLRDLQELGISGLCNVTNLADADKADMQNKKYLKILKLIWPSNEADQFSDQSSDSDNQNSSNEADETDEEDEQNVYDNKNARDSDGEQYPNYEEPSSGYVDGKPETAIDIPDEQESCFSSTQLIDGIDTVHIQDPVSSDAAVDEECLLKSLCPSTNLEMLRIESYGGPRFPDWMGDSSFSKLINMELTDCKCVHLPPLGQLPCLKFLSIDGMSVKKIGREFCGAGDANAFPSLETLSFHNMSQCERWGEVKEGDFCNLNKLCLFNCPQLRRLPDLFPSLERLEVERCLELTDIPNLPSLQVLHVCCCDGLTGLPTTLTSLCNLTIMYCHNLESLPPLPEHISLWIEDCERLPSVLPEA